MKEYFINLKNDKNKLWLFEIVSVLVLSLGFTLALKYISKKINTSLVSANINVIYKGDSKITKDLFLPIKENEIEEYGAVANFTVKGAENNVTDNNIVYDITLTDIDITDGLLDENFKFQLLKNDVIIGEGNFSSLQVEKKGEKYKYYQRVILNENVLNLPKYTDTADSFQLRIYILDNGSDQSSLMGQRFRAKVEIATYTTKVFTNRDRYTNLITRSCPKNTVTPVYVDNSGANTPVLAEGMIPVVYDEGLGIWLKADTNAGWYNYTDKIWANAVMVKNDASKESLCSRSRTDYIEAMPFTPIMEEDILAYYVWIPRYKYKLFNVSYSGGTSPSLIDVVFENKTASTGIAKCTTSEIGVETCQNKANGNYYTHPAFTFGNQELTGIWVGKFETTGNDITPTIKPNEISLRNQNVSTQFITSQKFNSASYLTNIETNQADAHMMKNIEWGAVAYLKQSKYGLGITDIAMNNSSGFYTGRSSGDPSKTDYSSEGTYKYNEPKTNKELIAGSGIEITISSPKSDNTYTWTNIGTSDSPIWKSANQGISSSSTSLTYNFILTGKGVISFDYSVSSESVSYDYLYYTLKQGDNIIDGTGETTKIGGTSYGTSDASMTYISKLHVLEPGAYTLEFIYRKDGSSDSGTDSGYVKNVKVINDAEVNIVNFIEQGGGAASTNGNVTGVYDMSGGAYEHVMGVVQDNTNTRSPMSGNNVGENSGYLGKVGVNYINSGNTLAFPNAKYYDLYANGTTINDQTAYNRSHLGDATGETKSWYDDNSYFISAALPWFLRGGYYSNKSITGIFNFYNIYGNNNYNYTFRSVLTVTK
mgnify:FL=1